MKQTIKTIGAILVMLAGILGSVLTFLVTLPPNETIYALISAVTIAIAVITAMIKLLAQIAQDIEAAFNLGANGGI